MDRIEIEMVARSGDVRAQIALAQRLEKEGQHAMARGLFANSARLGANDALRMLALNLLLFPPFEHDDGVNMLKIAGDRGDADALHYCGMIAARDESLTDHYAVMLDYLLLSAEKNNAPARSQLRLLAEMPEENSDWQVARSRIDLAKWTGVPEGKRLNEEPHVEIFENFLRPELCDWFIAKAAPRLTRATVYNPNTGNSGIKNDIRTNTTAEFPFLESDALFMMTQARILTAAKLGDSRLEDPGILHYATGEEFADHFDFLNPAEPTFAAEIAKKGQRIGTFLIYLNDSFEGGETHFPDLDIRFRGKKGDAILFSNVDANGDPSWKTRHAGRAPTSGEKWLLSQWIREAPETQS